MGDLYSEDLLQLAEGDKRPDFDDTAFFDAADMVYHAGGFDNAQMNTPEVRRLISETLKQLVTGISSGLPHEVPETVRYALENNAFIFSGFKAFHSLREVGLSLLDEKGNIKSFEAFHQDAVKVNNRYNHNYLYAEYNHAVGASLMAARWQQIEADGDKYDLQYRTAEDDHVRESHAILHGTTLPPSDPFWGKYLPPNGWNCRCTAVQVRKGKYPRSDAELSMKRGDNCTETAKQQIFRFNPGKELALFPPKHPYYKAPAKVKKIIEELSDEQKKEKRIAEMVAELPNNLTDEQKKAIAKHNLELENALGITKGKPMTVEEADKQAANPNYVPEYIIDPKGHYTNGHNTLSKNPKYNRKRDYPNSINCQTCAPAYALRLMGFNITAKPNTPGSKLDYLSRGLQCWEAWKNIDGTPAKHTSINDWLTSKKYKQMSPKRYLEYFNEVCKDPGVYELSIGWGRGGGHATILQRFPDGTLRYIEPQADNSTGSGYEWKDVEYLANAGSTKNHICRGIMRVDDKLFNTDFIEIFNK